MSMTEKAAPRLGAQLMDTAVLYVEDDSSAREVLTRYLSRRVARIYTAEDGMAGLEAFKMHRPALVITDVLMPNMDGCSMSREIRAIDPDVPIIMLSAHNESDQLLASIDLGVFKYLVKPIRLPDLLEAIQAALEMLEKRQALERALLKAQSALSSVEHDTEMLQDYVARSMGEDLESFDNIRLYNLPKAAISGDFFCAASHRGDLYLLLADASGHGLSAMVPAMGIPRRFREYAGRGFSLLAIADEINAILREQGLAGHFIAATLVRLTSGGHCIEVLNCGNPPALLIEDGGGLLQEFHSSTFPLGMADNEEMFADIERFELDTKAALYLFSDGLVDALYQSRLDYEGVRKIFTATEPVGLFDRVVQHVGVALKLGQPDDVTVAEVRIDPFAIQSFVQPAVQPPAPSGDDLGAIREEQRKRLKNISVLLVEDDNDARDYLARSLGRRVGSVYTARSGLEGLRVFGECQPRVVIADINMPGMSGMTMLEALRKLDADVPVIVVSGTSEVVHTATMFELGVSHFLQKPVDDRKLVDAIMECVNRSDASNGMRLSASVFEASPLAITIANKNREIIAVNAAFCEITGYGRDEVMGRNPKLLSSGKHDARFYQEMWRSINETGKWAGEIWNRRKGGELYLEWMTMAAVKDAAGDLDHYIAVFSDITENKMAEEKLRHMAHHDALTDLPNRTLLHDRLRQALLKAQRNKELVALMFLDLDHFKSINDVLGHVAGDTLLRLIARRLSGCVRSVDTVSRLGGDEFAILLPNVGSREMVSHIAAKVLGSFDQPCQIGDRELHVTTSVGISLFPSDGESTDALIKHADAAMYLAKKNGRNSFSFFDSSLSRQAERYIAIQHGMHNALENGEFFMLYQPKYSLSRNCVVGAEALLRWNSPVFGLVSPVEFIPIAEETGFIVTLGEWVAATVCDQLAAWKREGIAPVPVAINISPLHFQRGNIIRTLEYMLKSRDLDTHLIQIELTEGVVMNNSEATFATLNNLQSLGFHVAIDDFGTGFSSLSYLLRLPINEVKVDRSFISEIKYGDRRTDARTIAIPNAIIQLATNLGLNVVAEGVETAEQKMFLMDHGCDIVQGYLFSKPVDSAAYAKLLAGG